GDHSLSGTNSRVTEISAMSNQIAAAVDQQSSASCATPDALRWLCRPLVTCSSELPRMLTMLWLISSLADGMLELVQQFWARRRA
ncbi:chemotaxis protein, partial [Pseudomonas stutzeri]|nr:chemotaxis protein [Stutzerimonas stutzeri]